MLSCPPSSESISLGGAATRWGTAQSRSASSHRRSSGDVDGYGRETLTVILAAKAWHWGTLSASGPETLKVQADLMVDILMRCAKNYGDMGSSTSGTDYSNKGSKK